MTAEHCDVFYFHTLWVVFSKLQNCEKINLQQQAALVIVKYINSVPPIPMKFLSFQCLNERLIPSGFTAKQS